jgi:molybdopterin-binding protein
MIPVMEQTLTRPQLCALLGVAPKTLYLWEKSGKVRPPRRTRRGWRAYTPRDVAALRRHLGRDAPSPPARPAARDLEGLSARNQLAGTVVSVRGEGLLCEVVLRLGDGQEMSAVITRRSAERLGLRKGQHATAVVKATEVMLFR